MIDGVCTNVLDVVVPSCERGESVGQQIGALL
jgi:hypothetical protein